MEVRIERICIPMEEYKDLLIVKGRYEELKSQKSLSSFSKPDITWKYERDFNNNIMLCGDKTQREE